MAFRIDVRGRIDRDVAHVARTQLDSVAALLEVRDDRASIHEARKRLKMLRALVRLVRGPLGRQRYAEERALYRDAGRRLSLVRDADVLLATFDRLVATLPKADRAAIRAFRARLTDDQAGQRQALAEHVPATRAAMVTARTRIRAWPLHGIDSEDLLVGFARSYAAGRRAFNAAIAEPGDERLHEWRKRTKDFWYQLRLFRDAWPALTQSWIAETHRLTDLLGNDHDLAVLLQRLAAVDRSLAGTHVDSLRALIAAERERLQQQAIVLGLRTYAEKPRALRRRMRAYVAAWSQEPIEPAAKQAAGE